MPILVCAAVFPASAEANETYLVGYDGAPADRARIAEAGGELIDAFADIAVVSSSDPHFSERLRLADASVEEVVPDTIVEPAGKMSAEWMPSEPFYELQWAHRLIGIEAAWARGFTGAGITVAVVDSGIMADHPDLEPNIDFARSRSFVDQPWDFQASNHHGTAVSGIIAAAKNGFGTVGLAHGAKIMMLRISDDVAIKHPLSAICRALNYAVENGAKVINVSQIYRADVSDPLELERMRVAVKCLNVTVDRALVISAAGNSGVAPFDFVDWNVYWPAAFTLTAVGVGPRCVARDGHLQEDLDLELAKYSCRGYPDQIAAPSGHRDCLIGECKAAGLILPCQAFDQVFATAAYTNKTPAGTSMFSGTSAAAPHVSGLAAVIWSANPALTARQVREILVSNTSDMGEPGYDRSFGHGLIDARKIFAPGYDPWKIPADRTSLTHHSR